MITNQEENREQRDLHEGNDQSDVGPLHVGDTLLVEEIRHA